jgi:uncharacterized protein (DUF305 family)
MRRLVLVLAALATAAVLAACGGDGTAAPATAAGTAGTAGTGTTGTADHNAADVAFAQMMIPHHRQAVEMARLAAGRAADPAVAKLAARIEAAQAPEIETMAGWLASWGQPTAPAAGMHGMGHGGSAMPGTMPGMMSDADMAGLRAASGAAFDRLFLEMMIRHHEGAIGMARAERRDGLFGPATRLAATVEAAQAREVATMRGMLDAK